MLYYPINRMIHTLDENVRGRFLTNYMEEITALNFGQTMDLEMNLSQRVIQVNNYVDTVLCKTGVFPRFMVKQIYDVCLYNLSDIEKAKTKTLLVKVMDLLSIAFQIEDDLLNLRENELSKNKGFKGEDIYEGKLTIMILRAIETLGKKESSRLREILFMKTKDPNILDEAINLIKIGGGFDFAELFMEKSVKEAIGILMELPCESESSQESLLEIVELIKFLIKRNV